MDQAGREPFSRHAVDRGRRGLSPGGPTLIQPSITWAVSARNAFSIVSSTGPSSAPLAFAWMKIHHPPQDSPFVGVQVARCPLLDRDEDVTRQQAVRNLSKLAGFGYRQALQYARAMRLPDGGEISQQLRFSRTGSYGPSSGISRVLASKGVRLTVVPAAPSSRPMSFSVLLRPGRLTGGRLSSIDI